MSEDDDLNVGRLVAGRYRVDELLGRGGFGSVYKGWDVQIGRDVAIKLLDLSSQSRSADQTAELRARFRREAKAAGRINHRGVVTIYDFGIPDDGGEAYLIMEFLSGWDLADELDRAGAILPDRALRLFVPMLEALGKGHELGIVHKDIKPRNIFLTEPETASEALCLVDFGVARVLHEDKLTLTGLIVGTPQYMAPEYITETRVTPALDVYQMGLLLAESISGVPAVPLRESFVKTCNRHFKGEFDIPDELFEGHFGTVLSKALAVEPEERYEDAAQFAAALGEVDPRSVVLDSGTTMVFVRSERTDTEPMEPTLFPPMRPDQVSAELERDPSDVLDKPSTPVHGLRPDSDMTKAPADVDPLGETLSSASSSVVEAVSVPAESQPVTARQPSPERADTPLRTDHDAGHTTREWAGDRPDDTPPAEAEEAGRIRLVVAATFVMVVFLAAGIAALAVLRSGADDSRPGAANAVDENAEAVSDAVKPEATSMTAGADPDQPTHPRPSTGADPFESAEKPSGGGDPSPEEAEASKRGAAASEEAGVDEPTPRPDRAERRDRPTRQAGDGEVTGGRVFDPEKHIDEPIEPVGEDERDADPAEADAPQTDEPSSPTTWERPPAEDPGYAPEVLQ